MVIRYLSLDVSTKTGYAVLDENKETADSTPEVSLRETGLLKLPKKIDEYGTYPWSYVYAAREQARQLAALVARVAPDVVVLEETNLGKQRYSQKCLEFLHNALLTELEKFPESRGMLTPPVFYISSSKWRQALGLTMSKDDKKNNQLVKKAEALGVSKKSLGVRGKIKAKHLAIRYVNERFGLALKVKDNDLADAVALGCAMIAGAATCTGND